MTIRIVLWTHRQPEGDQPMDDGWYIDSIFEFEDLRTKDGKFTVFAQKAFDQALAWSIKEGQKSSIMLLNDRQSDIVK